MRRIRQPTIQKLLPRAAAGAVAGIAIGNLIGILFSVLDGSGHFSPVSDQLIAAMHGEVAAVIVQTAVCALLGAVEMGCTLLYECDALNLIWTTLIHWAASIAAFLPAAVLLRWAERDFYSLMAYVGGITVLFYLIWLFQYLGWKRKIRRLSRTFEQDYSRYKGGQRGGMQDSGT